jgi:hypothetical protein
MLTVIIISSTIAIVEIIGLFSLHWYCLMPSDNEH